MLFQIKVKIAKRYDYMEGIPQAFEPREGGGYGNDSLLIVTEVEVFGNLC